MIKQCKNCYYFVARKEASILHECCPAHCVHDNHYGALVSDFTVCEDHKLKRPTGEIVWNKIWGDEYACSYCGHINNSQTAYCPNCGGAMKNESNK